LRDVPAFMQACGLADDHLSSCFRSRGGDRIPRVEALVQPVRN